jgi:hypothetical protein
MISRGAGTPISHNNAQPILPLFVLFGLIVFMVMFVE